MRYEGQIFRPFSEANSYLPISGTLQRDRGKMIRTVQEILESRNTEALRSNASRGL